MGENEDREDKNINIEDVMDRQTELTLSGWMRELTDEEQSELYRLNKILQKYDEQKIREIELQKRMKKIEKLRDKRGF